LCASERRLFVEKGLPLVLAAPFVFEPCDLRLAQ